MRFEVNNRRWFERFIEARGDAFYAPDSIREHIDACLSEYARQQAYPMVIVDQGAILARVNLRQVDWSCRQARLGYRVAQSAAGRSVASFGVAAMIRRAREEWQLSALEVFASLENPASRRVLEKQGFEVTGCHSGMARVGDRRIDCLGYRLALSAR